MSIALVALCGLIILACIAIWFMLHVRTNNYSDGAEADSYTIEGE